MTAASKSYFHHAGVTPLLGTTIPGHVSDIVQMFPDREAVVSLPQGKRLTYAELAGSVDRLARGLLAMGFRKGDRIGISSMINIEWLLLQMAAARIGAAHFVNITPAYRPRELAYALQRSAVNGIFSIPSFKTSNYSAMLVEVIPELKETSPETFTSRDFPHLRMACVYDPLHAHETVRPFSGFFAWSDILARAEGVSTEELEAASASLDRDPRLLWAAISKSFGTTITSSRGGKTLAMKGV